MKKCRILVSFSIKNSTFVFKKEIAYDQKGTIPGYGGIL